MKKIIMDEELPEILEQQELEIPKGWFTIYHIKSDYAPEGIRKLLTKMESRGELESKIGRVRTKGYIKNMRLYRKI